MLKKNNIIIERRNSIVSGTAHTFIMTALTIMGDVSSRSL